MTEETGSSPGEEQESNSFEDMVAQAEPYSLPSDTEPLPTELTGQIYQSDEEGKFLLQIPSSSAWGELVLEIPINGVQSYDTVFEDSAGRTTYRLVVAPETRVKLLFHAHTFPAGLFMEEAATQGEDPMASWPYQPSEDPASASAQPQPPYEQQVYSTNQQIPYDPAYYSNYDPNQQALYHTPYGPSDYSYYDPNQSPMYYMDQQHFYDPLYYGYDDPHQQGFYQTEQLMPYNPSYYGYYGTI